MNSEMNYLTGVLSELAKQYKGKINIPNPYKFASPQIPKGVKTSDQYQQYAINNNNFGRSRSRQGPDDFFANAPTSDKFKGFMDRTPSKQWNNNPTPQYQPRDVEEPKLQTKYKPLSFSRKDQNGPKIIGAEDLSGLLPFNGVSKPKQPIESPQYRAPSPPSPQYKPPSPPQYRAPSPPPKRAPSPQISQQPDPYRSYKKEPSFRNNNGNELNGNDLGGLFSSIFSNQDPERPQPNQPSETYAPPASAPRPASPLSYGSTPTDLDMDDDKKPELPYPCPDYSGLQSNDDAAFILGDHFKGLYIPLALARNIRQGLEEQQAEQTAISQRGGGVSTSQACFQIPDRSRDFPQIPFAEINSRINTWFGMDDGKRYEWNPADPELQTKAIEWHNKYRAKHYAQPLKYSGWVCILY